MTINDIIKEIERRLSLSNKNTPESLGEYSLGRAAGVDLSMGAILTITKGYCLRPISSPRGESMPQTVEHCHAVMARDQELILEMKDEISKLKFSNNNLGQKLVRQCFETGELRVRLAGVSKEDNDE